MKYVRTKRRVWEYQAFLDSDYYTIFGEEEIIQQADTIEELCDEFVAIYDNKPHFHILEFAKQYADDNQVYGAIWTDKGLIYVAKMNEKGELELL